MNNRQYGESFPQSAPAIDKDWLAIAAVMVAQILTVGSLTLHAFGVFVHPLQTEFGWSRAQLSGGITVMEYTLGLSAPMWGLLVDRFGPRGLIVATTLVMSGLFASLSLMGPHLLHFYGTFFLLAALGTSPVLYSAVLVRLFDRRLGVALGMTMVGAGLGAVILPPLAQLVIASHGWRTAYLVLGVLASVIGVPAALTATRHVRGPVTRLGANDLLPLLPALRTRIFLLIVTLFFLLGFVTTGLITQLVPMLVDHGVTPAAAARIASAMGISALVARGILGWVIDRVQARFVLAAAAGCAAAAFLLFANGAGFSAALLIGLVIGAEVDYTAFVVRRYFPKILFGRVVGLTFLGFMMGGGTGPVVLGMVYDRYHSYQPGLLIMGMISAVAAMIALALPAYRRDALPARRADLVVDLI